VASPGVELKIHQPHHRHYISAQQIVLLRGKAPLMFLTRLFSLRAVALPSTTVLRIAAAEPLANQPSAPLTKTVSASRHYG
jgi:hypothetical protein